MKSTRAKEIISQLLIVSPLWWTAGCHSTYEITNPADASGEPIEVITTGSTHHLFNDWRVDNTGSIGGSGPYVVPIAVRSGDGTIEYRQPFRVIPKDSIATIHAQRFNVGSSVLTSILVAAGIAAGAVLLFIGGMVIGTSR
jgi:hypothetical protein